MIGCNTVTTTARIAALLVVLSACAAPDFGDCDMAKLGGGSSSAPKPFDGQLLLQSSCAGGNCHSSSARGALRKGAPAGLNFDVVPASTADKDLSMARHNSGVVSNHSGEIWEQVNDGTMPPPKPAGSGALSGSDKDTLRNWLACGAPVVEVPNSAGAGADPWTRVFTALSTTCIGCHSMAAASGSGGGFVLAASATDVCGAYTNVIAVATKSAACTGRVLVKASDPDNSVLLGKLEGGTNLCGTLMPPTNTTPFATASTTNMQTVADLRQWIASGAPKPPTCP
jgi:hypothetical protein